MTPHGLDDERLAEAWTAPDGAAGGRTGCPAPELWWDAARGALDAAGLRHLLDHAAGCAECALALKAAGEIHAVSGLETALATERTPHVAREPTLWERLAASILRPEAAFAYLLLLALSYPVYRALTPVPEAGRAVSIASVIGLESDVVSRGGEPSAPVAIAIVGDAPTVLRLFLDREEIAAGRPLAVSMTTDGAAVAAFAPPAEAVGPQGTLDIGVDPGRLPRGVPLRLTVTSDGTLVFERAIVITSANR